MSEYSFKQIGLVRSEHDEAVKTPIQPVFAEECFGTIEVFTEYAEGLAGIEGFSHIFVFYVLDRRSKVELTVKPFMGEGDTGIFSTRHPNRPNPLGMSVLKIEKIEGNILHVSGVDILDGTPVIDIKPYIARFDLREDLKSGWTDKVSDAEAAQRGLREFKK